MSKSHCLQKLFTLPIQKWEALHWNILTWNFNQCFDIATMRHNLKLLKIKLRRNRLIRDQSFNL